MGERTCTIEFENVRDSLDYEIENIRWQSGRPEPWVLLAALGSVMWLAFEIIQNSHVEAKHVAILVLYLLLWNFVVASIWLRFSDAGETRVLEKRYRRGVAQMNMKTVMVVIRAVGASLAAWSVRTKIGDVVAGAIIYSMCVDMYNLRSRVHTRSNQKLAHDIVQTIVNFTDWAALVFSLSRITALITEKSIKVTIEEWRLSALLLVSYVLITFIAASAAKRRHLYELDYLRKLLTLGVARPEDVKREYLRMITGGEPLDIEFIRKHTLS